LEGGLIGWIAKEHLGHHSAALGPSSAVTNHCQGFSVTDTAGITYWDDRLMDDEIHLICRMYHCYTGTYLIFLFISFTDTITGSGSQMADVSWWPTPVHWNNFNANGLNWGHWTEWDEIWYQQRVKAVLSGKKTGVPFTQSSLRNKLKGATAWRQVTKCIQEQSALAF
jgi:hypothetical protein